MISISARRIVPVKTYSPIFSGRSGLHTQIPARYGVIPVMAVPPLVHRLSYTGTPERAAGSVRFYLSRRNWFPQIYFKLLGETIPSSKTELTENSVMLQSLFTGNNALWQLLGALWSIYRSNNLQLSQSFLSLLHSASERRISLSGFISSSRVLQTLARTQIIQTRKLNEVLFHESRTQRHVFNKTASELNRQFLILRDRMPPRLFNNFRYFSKILNNDTFLLRRIFIPGAAKPVTYTNPGMIFHTKRMDFRTESRILDRLSFLSRYTGREHETKLFHKSLFTRAWLVPVLYRLYEELEANSMFYSASSYQSVRTLYRLTNSLWKVYNNQNLELSRSFTRLINTVTEKNTELKIIKHNSEMFSTTRSLSNLINALRTAFSGNNLSLRHSLVSLISDINEAGSSHRKYYKTINNTLNLCHISTPEAVGYSTYILHKPSDISGNDQYSSTLTRDLERSIAEKLKSFTTPSLPSSKDTESLYKYFSDRLKREQLQDWRFEKLQRGIL